MNESIAVVGPGAIGTTVAATLHEASRTPLLCSRTARENLVLERADGSIIVPGPVLTDPEKVDSPVDLVFLAVKATQMHAAVPWLQAPCTGGAGERFDPLDHRRRQFRTGLPVAAIEHLDLHRSEERLLQRIVVCKRDLPHRAEQTGFSEPTAEEP